jgi:hypothetical protein
VREIQNVESRTFAEALMSANTLPEPLQHRSGPPAGFPALFITWVVGAEVTTNSGGDDALLALLRDDLLFNADAGVRTKHHAHVLRLLNKLAGTCACACA